MNAVGGSISSASLFSLGAVRFFNWPLLISSYSSSPSSKTLISTFSNNKKTLKSITMAQSSSSSPSTTQPSAAAPVTASPSEVAVEATKPNPKPWLIVGLGNPGKMYNGTRHNVGFEMVDAIAEAEGISMSCVSNKAIFGKGLIGNVPVMLAKPQTFMNASGQSVSYCQKVDMEDTTGIYHLAALSSDIKQLVIMRSVIDHFKGSKDFPRLRIGIGRPPGKMNPVSFVMRAFNKQERQEEIPASMAVASTSGVCRIHSLKSPQSCDKYALHKQSTNRSFFWSVPAAAAGKGGGVLDIPTREKTKPGREAEFGVRKSRKISPPYRVMLHNDDYNKREYVVQVLMKVIPGMTVDNAVNIMQEAHINGLSVVIICAQADAEEHCTQLRGNGLRSSIEPASGGC
ncbi:hypothetical protein RHSIM_Rhsim12G0144000 [Rhododendron simsii]|uniref:Adaptor protein ClpS core domain-containing protein n=1 Tax=Rhododendron simsii TaxID=118357 RepID=A0A834G4F7_RHOSS|nr:hypothetical protein RHSIM_Rhsim12G0144000 [Rhododendron simsii]